MRKIIQRIDKILRINEDNVDVISKREKYLETKFLDYDINYCDYYDCILLEQKIIKNHNQYIESLYKLKELLMKVNQKEEKLSKEFYLFFYDINMIYYKNSLGLAINDIIERKNKFLEKIILSPFGQLLPANINDINEDIVFLKNLNQIYDDINKFNQSNLLLDYEKGDYIAKKSQPTKRERFIYNHLVELDKEKQKNNMEQEVVSFITTFPQNVPVEKKKIFSFKKHKKS